MQLTSSQRALVRAPLEHRLFVQGPAGSGKTTAAVQRLLHMLDKGIPGSQVLLLLPQRTLGDPYYEALASPYAAAGGQVNLLTLGGLAQRMVDLYWPYAAQAAGFAHPERPPVFLTLETAQYYLRRIVQPLIEQGYFQSVTIDRHRLYSQILDNLNKAALTGFPYTDIARKLKSAWMGDVAQVRVYDDAQDCAERFRRFCLEHNLLDFSLQLEVFRTHLWPQPDCRRLVQEACQHIIADNIEEDTPASHELLRELLPVCASALLVYDCESGFRSFLGADPLSALELSRLCDTQLEMNQPLVSSPPVQALSGLLVNALSPERRPASTQPGSTARQALEYENHRYYPQMFDWVVLKICELVNREGIPPGEIVVLAPFLTDTLRFSLTNRLEAAGIPVRSHRPSRALREEPATQCLLTFAALAHPQWNIRPPRSDVAYALMQAIDGLDLVRAQLLADIVYRTRDGSLSSFHQIQPETQERITYVFGERYEQLRQWLEDYRQGMPDQLDFFFSRIFGEVLSQPGFRFHVNYNAGELAANLVDSARRFRWAVEGMQEESPSFGKEYLEMVREGVIASLYMRSWLEQPEDSLLLAPAYTFLLANRPVDYQFWLDIGSRSWYERLSQPLTHPFVLSQRWEEGRVWTDADDQEANYATLSRLALGLLRRCRKKIFLGISELNEQGFEYQGPLLKAFQRVLREVQT